MNDEKVEWVPQKEYEVSSSIPLPDAKTKSPLREAMKYMNIGDSFFACHPAGTFHTTAKLLGIKVAVRQVEGGMRCWMVK